MDTTVSPKIRRLCWLVRAVAIVLLGSVLLLYLGSWLFPDLAVWDQHWARIARVGGLPVKAARRWRAWTGSWSARPPCRTSRASPGPSIT